MVLVAMMPPLPKYLFSLLFLNISFADTLQKEDLQKFSHVENLMDKYRSLIQDGYFLNESVIHSTCGDAGKG